MTSNYTSNSRSQVAVIIVNYNSSDQVISAVESLRNEEIQKIIVIDNASPQDSPELITLA